MKLKLEKISTAFMYVLLILVLVAVALPLIYLFCASFKTNAEIMVNPGQFFPKTPTLDNYKMALQSEDFNLPVLLTNSIIYTVCCVAINIFISSMAGYSFAKGDFPFKKIIFACLSFLLFVKLGGISIYATFDVLNFFHLKRSLYSLLIIKLFGVPIVNIYLVKSYVTSLPDGILEAAKIDGCSFFGTFLKVGVPIIKPILATIGILAFQQSWNDYLMPTIFTLTQPEQRTLIVGLMQLKNSSGAATSWNLMLAGSVVALLPVLVAYAFGNRYFIQGLSAGAVKE